MRVLVLVLAGWLAASAWGKELFGTVTSVTDGDTLTLRVECADLEVVTRLAGIDAPESGQRYGKKSAQALRAAVAGKPARPTYYKRDKYGRLVGRVSVDGRDVNLAQVASGWAWHFKAYAHEQDDAERAAFSEAEAVARAGRLGLWRDTSPMPPWQWRENHPAEMAEAAAPEHPGDDGESAEFSFATFAGEVVHIGPRGGRYIVLPNGTKRYLSQDE
jgi:endonuclease YncB( thermonuclease family)